MSKEANVTAIGAFVVIGVFLLVASVIVLGSGQFFKEKNEYVTFFSGSVKGLQTGAPVKFRGVDVGTVTDIGLIYRSSDSQLFIPVTIEIISGRAEVINGAGEEVSGLDKQETRKTYRRLIDKRGLRARLAMQSIVTGQLFVQLDMLPDEPKRVVGIHPTLAEIPTVPSSFEKISKTLDEIPFEQMAEKFMNVLSGLEEITNSKDLFHALKGLSDFLDEAKGLIESLHGSVPGFKAELEKLSKEAGQAIDQANRTLKTYEHLVEEGSPVEYELRGALAEMKAAAKSLRIFADYLERHPEAILKGKN